MEKNNKLLDELTQLKIEENNLKRCLEIKYFDNAKRTEIFNKLKKCKKDIERIKFKIRMERKLKNENSNSFKSNN